MNILVIHGDRKLDVGKVYNWGISHPITREMTDCVFKVLEESTFDKYLDFCKENEYDYKPGYRTGIYFYRIEIYD